MNKLGMFFFFQAEDGIRDHCVTGVQTCALPISRACGASAPINRLRAVANVSKGHCGLNALPLISTSPPRLAYSTLLSHLPHPLCFHSSPTHSTSHFFIPLTLSITSPTSIIPTSYSSTIHFKHHPCTPFHPSSSFYPTQSHHYTTNSLPFSHVITSTPLLQLCFNSLPYYSTPTTTVSQAEKKDEKSLYKRVVLGNTGVECGGVLGAAYERSPRMRRAS